MPLIQSLSPTAKPRNLRLWLLFGFVVVVTQLFEFMDEPTVIQALSFWVVRLGTVAVGFIVAETLVGRFLPGRWDNPPWLKGVIVPTLLACVPVCLAELAMESWVPQKADFDDDTLWAISPWLAIGSEYITWLSLLLPANLILWYLVDAKALPTAVTGPMNITEFVEPEFLKKTRGIRVVEVLALQADEHYIKVYTKQGQELIHHRLSEAVAAMPATLGTRVHRSWWVSDEAVLYGRRVGRRYRLELSNELSVPVSDAYLQVARERGYLRKTTQKSES